MRLFVSTLILVGVSACAPTVPNSAAGVGFNDYAAYERERAQRDAALSGGKPLPGAGAVSVEGSVESGAPLSALSVPAVTAPIATNAVTQVSAPSSVNSDGSPNIVAFALATSNAVGQSIYPRDGAVSADKLAKNCAKYRNPEEAQQKLLSSGGPQKDKYDIDPDGDGFACYWNPAPFRTARDG
ncbi:MAG: hypothetical protein ABJO27_24120 [Pseudoruegeria sp.]